MTAKTKKSNKTGANPRRIRYAFAPILQQFRAHTRKNEARLWVPIETNLISRYEFATLSPQCRYVFVAILLYCAGNGINEIPLDARFMSSVLSVDYRTIEKSFDELLFQKLLQERKEKTDKKEQTERQDALDARVSVFSENSFSEESENQNEAEEILLKEDIPPPASNGKHRSRFSIEECLRYVELCKVDGEAIQSPRALASHLYKTGEADSIIFNKLFPAEAELAAAQSYGEPVKFSDQPCSVCFGAKMADADGNGFRACKHCANERGKSTGLEPEKGEKTQ